MCGIAAYCKVHEILLACMLKTRNGMSPEAQWANTRTEIAF